MKVPRASKIDETNVLQTPELLEWVVDSLRAHKAEDIVTIDLKDKTDIADAVVVVSGVSERHVVALSDYLSDDLSKHGVFPLGVEGKEGRVWVLVDLGDVIVHIFIPEVRSFYNLERMWGTTLPESVEKVF